jgi:hypothetical protein
MLRWTDYVPQETMFWRRSLWEKSGGGLDEKFTYALDWELLLRFMKHGARIRRVPRFLGGFRVHALQKTQANASTSGTAESRCFLKVFTVAKVSRREVSSRTKLYFARSTDLRRTLSSRGSARLTRRQFEFCEILKGMRAVEDWGQLLSPASSYRRTETIFSHLV